MSSHASGNLQTNEGHNICEATLQLKIFFWGGGGGGGGGGGAQKEIYQQKQDNDIPTIILNLLK